ncbi:MAG: ArnT family glycosyltransferase [Candidatus Zipacnadales bacterium]
MRKRSRVDLLGGGTFRWGIIIGAPLALGLLLLAKSFAVLIDPGALDMAQLARNLARTGHFHTNVIRPFSLLFHASIENHPDLYNEPLQPVLLSLVFRVWGSTDKTVAATSVILWMASCWILLALARRLFSWRVAALAGVLYAGNTAVLGNAISGTPIMLASVLLLLLLWVLYSEETREGLEVESSGVLPPWRLVLAGVLVGLATLTDYYLAALIVPVLVYVIVNQPSQRWSRGLLVLAAMVLVLLPWAVHNQIVAGTPFPALRLYDMAIGTPTYPGDSLLRSMDPADVVAASPFRFLWNHLGDLLLKTRAMVGALQTAMSRQLGGVVGAFFFVSLFLRLGDERLVRLRRCFYGMFVVLLPVLALTRFQATEFAPFVPFATILAAGAMRQLIGSIDYTAVRHAFQAREWRIGTAPVWRTVVLGFFVWFAIWSFTKWLRAPGTAPFLAGVTPFEYLQAPPEHSTERLPLVMSDVPQDIAWYGDRPVVWLTQTARGYDRLVAQIAPVGILHMAGTYMGRGWSEIPGPGTWWAIAAADAGPYKGLIQHGPVGFERERLRALPSIQLPRPSAPARTSEGGEV